MYKIGNSFTILESVDSTNNYAMAKVHAGLAKHGDAYFALDQTAGKGQRGKAWKSVKGENIILSCILEPAAIDLQDPFLLSTIIALSCYDLVNHYAKTGVSIKWPNDIYWRDRKAGGILIENSYKGKLWQYSIAGIGLNINQTVFSPVLANPVSLKQVTGNTYNIIELANELCNYIQARLDLLMSGKYNFLNEYNLHLYKLGELVKLRSNETVFETTITEVNEKGQLVTFNGIERAINWGDAEWIIS